VSDKDSNADLEQMLKEGEEVSKDEEAPATPATVRPRKKAKTKMGKKYKKQKKFPRKKDEEVSEVVNVQLPFTFSILNTLLLITIYRLLCNFSERTPKTTVKFVSKEVKSLHVTLVTEPIT
jgi:hypothetical protein